MKLLKKQSIPPRMYRTDGGKYYQALINLSPDDCLLCDETEVAGLRGASYRHDYKIASRWLENHQCYGVWKLSDPKQARRKAA